MERSRRSDIPHTLGHSGVALLLVGSLALILIVAWNMPREYSDEGKQISVSPAGDALNPLLAYRVQIAITSLDEDAGVLKVRATLAQGCAPACTDPVRISLYAATIVGREDLLPVEESFDFTPQQVSQTKELDLPVEGDASRYPFDHWSFALLVLSWRILPDGTAQELTRKDGLGQIALTVQNRASDMVMRQLPDLPEVRDLVPPESPGALLLLEFDRPISLRAVTVLLVGLIGAVAIFAVLISPLDGLVVNTGALVLGVWSVRAMLLGTEAAGSTLVDLALAVVMLVSLLIVSLRVLLYWETQSRIPHIRRRRERDGPADSVPPRDHPGTS